MLKEFGHLYYDGVRAEAERRFGLDRTSSVPRSGSHSYVYEYPRPDTGRILKITHSSHRSVSQILGEIDFVNYLADSGMKVSRAVPALGGGLVETLDAESGYFLAVTYERAPGALIDWREWTPEMFWKWGALIGRIHASTKDYTPSDGEFRRGHWHEDRDWDIALSIPASRAEFRRKGQGIKDWMLSLPKDRDSYGLIHSDLHQWNMLFDGEFLWPIDFDNVHYDWFLSDFTTVIINAVVCQGYHYRKGEYEYWTGGAPMDSATFFRWFMEPLLEGYSSENMLDAEWFGRLPQFLERHWFTFWVDNMRDPLFSLLSEDEQRAEFPWRTLRQIEAEFRDGYWTKFAIGNR